MLVHVPVACSLLTPVSDATAWWLSADFFWQASAVLVAVGLVSGVFAATAGALDFARVGGSAIRVALAHACLMAATIAITAAGLLGRAQQDFSIVMPPPAWAIAAGLVGALVMLVGAWFGAELVYGHGVGMRAPAVAGKGEAGS
jgi:uncharacterized membrane protein